MSVLLPNLQDCALSDAAERLARMNWRVVPFKPDRSRAYVKYADLAARSPVQIKRDFELWPDALLAIHLPENIVVLDLDPRQSNLSEILDQLNDRFVLPLGPKVKTPKGGLHLWFSLPDGMRARNWTSAHGRFPVPGVDIRTFRGLAILPPSKRQDGAYSWGHWQETIPMAPEALVAALQSKDPERFCSEYAPGNANAPKANGYVKAIVRNEYERVAFAVKGNRNQALFVASARLGALYGGGEISDAREDLVRMAELSGLIADDGARSANATINSGWRAGLAQPRKVTE